MRKTGKEKGAIMLISLNSFFLFVLVTFVSLSIFIEMWSQAYPGFSKGRGWISRSGKSCSVVQWGAEKLRQNVCVQFLMFSCRKFGCNGKEKSRDSISVQTHNSEKFWEFNGGVKGWTPSPVWLR